MSQQDDNKILVIADASSMEYASDAMKAAAPDSAVVLPYQK